MDSQRDSRLDDDPVSCAGEAALIAAAQADPAAFGILYRQYLPQLYRYVRSRLPTDDEAADVTQSVFLKALEALPAYQGRGVPFAAWLFRIARNALIDVSRRQRPAIPWQDVSEAQQPEATAQHDALSHFDALIAPLDNIQREILRFRRTRSILPSSLPVGISSLSMAKRLAAGLPASCLSYWASVAERFVTPTGARAPSFRKESSRSRTSRGLAAVAQPGRGWRG